MWNTISASRCLTAAATTLVLACDRSSTGPAGPNDAQPGVVKFWEAGSSVAWNKTARDLIATRAVTSPIAQVRILTYLSVAQYNAVVGAEGAKDRGSHPSPAAAAAGASVVVLKSFFPADADLLEATLADQLAGEPSPGAQNKDITSGEALGRTIGANVVVYAASDNTNVLVPPPAPIGPGYWTSSLVPPEPSIRGLYGTRPFALTSGDQFRPPPHPAFGSPEFLAALAEVRAFSDNRTPAQIALAQFWATRGPGFMNEVGTGLILKHRRTEREAARVLALANMAGFDALIGCFDAKFAYWLVRPTKADPAITLAIPLPNHPSYISGHSCVTSSYASVLADAFPTEATRLEGMIEEAGLSRIYGGLHYRFDCEAGQELGRKVAALVLRTGPTGHGAIPLD